MRLLLIFFFMLFTQSSTAQINPWINNNLYDPEKWDSAGPRTATRWLHPGTWTPNQEWGVFSGDWETTGAITGSWGNLRDSLATKGIQLIPSYFGQFAANPAGGEKEGESWKGDLNIGLYLDLERILGLKRTYFTASFSYINAGRSLSSAFIGNQFPVQLSSGSDNGAERLIHLTIGKQLFDNTTEIVFGRIIAGEDFATLRLACTSINQAICGTPIAANQSINFPVYPFAVWGARLKIKPGTSWYAQAGTYLVYPDLESDNKHGTEFGSPDGSGLLTIGEVGYIRGSFAQNAGLPGKIKFGAYYDSERLQDLETAENERGTWGAYIMGEQMFYSEDNTNVQGLSAFLALSYAPEDLNIITFMAAGGLSYQGIITGRNNDIFSFISSVGKFSDDLEGQEEEILLELNYRIQIAPWLYLTPDIQVIINPDGKSDIDDALVIGFAVGTVI